MTNETPVLENESDATKRTETESRSVETNKETEESLNKAVEMLETPPEGDFTVGLKAFRDWLKNIFAK